MSNCFAFSDGSPQVYQYVPGAREICDEIQRQGDAYAGITGCGYNTIVCQTGMYAIIFQMPQYEDDREGAIRVPDRVLSGEDMFLCIYSMVADDVGSPDYFDGHAALMLVDTSTSPATKTTYGVWPDYKFEEGNEYAPFDNHVRKNYPEDNWDEYKYPYIYCQPIDQSQLDVLNDELDGWWYWIGTTTCASFASEVFYEVTGIDVDADDYVGFETPRELGKSIRELNGGKDQCPLPW